MSAIPEDHAVDGDGRVIGATKSSSSSSSRDRSASHGLGLGETAKSFNSGTGKAGVRNRTGSTILNDSLDSFVEGNSANFIRTSAQQMPADLNQLNLNQVYAFDTLNPRQSFNTQSLVPTNPYNHTRPLPPHLTNSHHYQQHQLHKNSAHPLANHLKHCPKTDGLILQDDAIGEINMFFNDQKREKKQKDLYFRRKHELLNKKSLRIIAKGIKREEKAERERVSEAAEIRE